MITRGQATVETVTALLQNSAMTLILGVITLGATLAMVLAHNIWSGSVLAVVVTLIGWMALIKSLFFLFLPHEMEVGLFLGQLQLPLGKSGDVKGTIRSDAQYLMVSRDVRRHRLISISYISLLLCHRKFPTI
jgi:vacuolar-type H+-ATPase subunit I/STV1